MFLLLSCVFLAASVAVFSVYPESGGENDDEDHSVTDSSAQTEKKSPEPDASAAPKGEAGENGISFMKAVWVPFMSLDLSREGPGRESAEKRLEQIFDKVAQAGADTVFLHVRPFCDALYSSSLFPPSHLLSGTQGKQPGYDFLELALSAAKKRNIHIHAWINPLRVSYGKTPAEFSDDNPYIKWKNDSDKSNDRWCFSSGGNIYLNPAYPQVRKLITDGVREIVRNYDVDGIVIDDYFYPADDMNADKKEYDIYAAAAGETYLSQNNWRKQNINSLLSSIYSAVHYERSDCVFGISPQCNMENDEKLAADIKSWSEITGYCDYLSPQTYVSENHPTLPFAESVEQWKKLVKNSNVRLYISLGLYKEGTDADGGTWLQKDHNIQSQIDYCRKNGTDGYVLYSYEDLDKLEE